jgi:hypothetical protein
MRTTCPESRHVPPGWSVATQRECIGSLRHKISLRRRKPWKEQGLSMREKYTRLSRFASPLALGVIRLLAAVAACAQNWRSWRGVRQFPRFQVARPFGIFRSHSTPLNGRPMPDSPIQVCFA